MRPSRPPIGAVWGWMQTVAGRSATEALLPGRALVLSPHQDDETIGCGLLMAEKAKRGIPVAVVVATDGQAGWFSPTPRPAPNDIAGIRQGEWHRALDILAVDRADRFELGFPDGGLSDQEQELTDRIRELLRHVRPSQVFVTRSGDPHPDHRVLSLAVRRAVTQVYGPDSFVPDGRPASYSSPSSIGPRPQVFTYRVYPGEGLWPEGRPSRVGVGRAVLQVLRSVLRLPLQRPLLLRAPGAIPKKTTAIDAYDSQSALLRGELRYVWNTGVELYWPTNGQDPMDPRGT